jgi:hypothetical protein
VLRREPEPLTSRGFHRINDGDGGATWYWFEGTEDDVIANGVGEGSCTGCHSRAPRDFVFTQVGS